ncbi:hypothetical protein FGO68_gene6591 [Halteria grandinella]|uniref:Uncharacterized protein n=1 Tax=Halteria grandinella TaxID=5974 RepID=A0A8J8N9U8_HALGN|nr:hypothetical protein FGO68_gene6591 [Halteria grandinella]
MLIIILSGHYVQRIVRTGSEKMTQNSRRTITIKLFIFTFISQVIPQLAKRHQVIHIVRTANLFILIVSLSLFLHTLILITS